MPFNGAPNSKDTLYDKHGQVVTERWYGPDGTPIKDRDWVDHGFPDKHPVPHDWGIRSDGKFGHLPAYPSSGLTIDDRPQGLALYAYGEVGDNFNVFPIPCPGPYYFPYPLHSPLFGGVPVIVY